MIDLRSDTVTRPGPAMREAMAAAPVGDDVYGDDPTTTALEERVAELLGKEAAVFVPTGTMSNQIALRAQTEPGDLVLIDRAAHIVRAEAGAGAAVSGVTMHHLHGTHGIFDADTVREALGREHPFNPTTLSSPARLLCLENTHNGGGGSVWPLDLLREVCATGRGAGLSVHLDGARLWHATAASGVEEREYAEPFDTVNVCFSKGLGAPVGSALAGSAATMQRARRFRQQLGGGMRQSGLLAAAALYAIDHHRPHLAADVDHAKALAAGLTGLDGASVDLGRVESNIVRFEVVVDANSFVDACYARGLHMLPNGHHGVRAVLHRDVGAEEVEAAVEIMAAALNSLREGGAGSL